MLTLTLLGQVTIARDGQSLLHFRSQAEIALLVYLAHTGQTHSRETLADLLWEARSTKQSLANLRTVLTRLKGSIGAELVVAHKTLAFQPDARQLVDSVRLQTELAAVGSPQSPAEAARLATALRLYEGDFLAGLYLPDAPRFNEWVVVEQENLRQQLFAGFQRLISYAVEAPNPPPGIEAAQHWLAVDAFSEAAHAQLIHLLALNGQTTAALAQYARLVTILDKELGMTPQPATAALVERIRRGDVAVVLPAAVLPAAIPLAAISPPATRERGAIAHNLPRELTPFVGRAAERAALTQRLRDPAYPLVTVAGEGGAGKTRLALTATRDLLEDAVDIFPDGVWFVPLAALDGRSSVREAVATAIGDAMGAIFHGERSPSEQLLALLRPKACLLLLDNFEHLLDTDAVDLVIELLQEGQRLRLLATSRARLDLNSEFVVRLAGLAVPFDAPPSGVLAEAAVMMDLTAYDSVRLFAERAARTAEDFRISDCAAEVVAICRYLGGMPLGIELAAAWVQRMPCAKIAAAIQSNLDFLSSRQRDMPPRQRSMRAVFEYSWQLLGEAARRTLAQVSLFRGGFTREAALAVIDSAAGLDPLVEHSLLERDKAGRYAIHELLRDFAAEKLAQAETSGLPDEAAPHERHSRYYLDLVGRVTLEGPLAEPSLSAAQTDLDNVREAWRWAVGRPCVKALAAGWQGLWTFYARRELFQEGEDVFRAGVEGVRAAQRPDSEQRLMVARLALARSAFLNVLTRFEEAMALAQDVVAFTEEQHADSLAAQARLVWGTALYREGQFDDALAQMEQGLALAHDAGLDVVEADVRRRMGTAYLEKGEFGRAQQQLDRALALYRRVGHRLGEGEVLGDLGWLEQRELHFDAARAYLSSALAIQREIDNRHGMSMALINLAVVYGMQGDFDRAYDCQQEALHILEDMDDRYHKSLLNHNLGVQLSRMGDYAAAQLYYERSMAIDREMGDLAGVAWTQNNLGLLYNHLGEFETALGLHQESLAIAQKRGARTTEGLALARMGQDLYGLGRLEGLALARMGQDLYGLGV